MRRARAVVVPGLLLLAGCQEIRIGPGVGSVRHVVICTLKHPGDAGERARLMDASKGFVGTVPGLVRVEAGPVLKSDRAFVRNDFDVGIVMVFESAEALAAYNASAVHQRAVREVLAPLAEKVEVFDFTER